MLVPAVSRTRVVVMTEPPIDGALFYVEQALDFLENDP
jgi:hypothetical protein